MGKKQHYIPRFNLAGFVDPISGMLLVYEKGKPARESKPENTGFENYFYAYTNAQQQREVEFLEKAFSKKESDAAVVFEKIKGFKSIYPPDREPFADFVALQIVRVPSFRTFTNKLAGKVFRDQIKQIASNPVEFETFVVKMEEAAGKRIPGTVEEMRQYLLSDKYEIIQKDPELHLSVIAYAKTVAKIVINMNWNFIRATSRVKFLTSDNPVHKSGPRIDHRGGEIFLPVSQDVLFRGHWKSQKRQVEYLQAPTEDNIKHMNWLTIRAANRFVYASQNLNEIRDLVDKDIGTLVLDIDKEIQITGSPFLKKKYLRVV